MSAKDPPPDGGGGKDGSGPGDGDTAPFTSVSRRASSTRKRATSAGAATAASQPAKASGSKASPRQGEKSFRDVVSGAANTASASTPAQTGSAAGTQAPIAVPPMNFIGQSAAADLTMNKSYCPSSAKSRFDKPNPLLRPICEPSQVQLMPDTVSCSEAFTSITFQGSFIDRVNFEAKTLAIEMVNMAGMQYPLKFDS